MGRVYLITGNPGSGKTTVIRSALSLITLKSGGFYTEEIREAGVRAGFKIITLEGEAGILAHVDIPGNPRIGKYGINLKNLDDIAVTSVQSAIDRAELIVIDEIGKMELISPLFREIVQKSIKSGKKVLASIMLSSHPFADAIKKMPEVKLIMITNYNRQLVLDGLVREISN